ncbi:E3 binding domain-containing protein [Luteolibacter pohnpeiensis]|uniref:E3 binding domain-containing protein n=1 Tax=Luteolibacter pohnpeiensis TaxID=454153 RepID=A0A934SGR0_9BACT|nr:E3 binding domain-containing protein [Luteolibacter pohnpeiensis]MBK1884868.1 E3 binding domain-containing protein [Luteolibacter pohnpeiensis]
MNQYRIIDPKGFSVAGVRLESGKIITGGPRAVHIATGLHFKQLELVEPKRSAPPPVEPQKPTVDVSDAARKLAEEHSIDLTTIKGTGSDGTIIKADVEAAIEAAKN